jgi:nicotinamidase-related amidase
MTVTVLDPNAALLVIDLQKGIAALPAAHPIDDVVRQAAALAEAFRRRGLPVILVNVAGRAPGRTERARGGDFPPDWTDFLPALSPQPHDHVVTKHSPGAFTNTGLDAYLRAAAVTQLVIAGVATSNGVECTARQAFELGFNVAFATDAMTDRDAAAHDNSVTRIFPAIGETGTTQELIERLANEA